VEIQLSSVLVFLGVTPVVVSANSDLDKQNILKENRGKSGVYRWTNLVSGKTYVGSSVNLSRRFSSYYSAAFLMKFDYMVITRALLKYGYSNFKLFLNIAKNQKQ